MGANKRLVATKDAIPEALWELYEADSSQEAIGENAFVERSDRTSEGP
jgi:hypothetical protein